LISRALDFDFGFGKHDKLVRGIISGKHDWSGCYFRISYKAIMNTNGGFPLTMLILDVSKSGTLERINDIIVWI